jgi:glycosyltransferase involved in cell wall biosynthesis
VKDGVNGLLVAKNDVDALASALGRVVYDKTLAQKLVAGGRANYEAQFTKAAFQRDSLAFYEQVRAHAGPFGG